MYEEDLKTVEKQIERVQAKLKQVRGETAKYQLERKLKILFDMRFDILIQIENYKE